MSNDKWIEEVERLTKEIKESEESVSKLFFLRARAFFELEEYGKSKDDFKKGFSLKPMKKEYEECRDYYSLSIAKKPRDQYSYIFRGFANTGLGEYEKAIDDYSIAVVESKSQSYLAFNSRGIAYLNLKQYNNAIKDFTDAIDLKPDYAIAYYNRGNVYFNMKKFQEAYENYMKSIEFDPSNSYAYYNAAFVLKSMTGTKDLEERRPNILKYLEKVIQLEQKFTMIPPLSNDKKKKNHKNDQILNNSIEEIKNIELEIGFEKIVSELQQTDFVDRDFEKFFQFLKKYSEVVSQSHVKIFFDLFTESHTALSLLKNGGSSSSLFGFSEEGNDQIKNLYPPSSSSTSSSSSSSSSSSIQKNMIFHFSTFNKLLNRNIRTFLEETEDSFFSVELTRKELQKLLMDNIILKTLLEILSEIMAEEVDLRRRKMIFKKTISKLKADDFFSCLITYSPVMANPVNIINTSSSSHSSSDKFGNSSTLVNILGEYQNHESLYIGEFSSEPEEMSNNLAQGKGIEMIKKSSFWSGTTYAKIYAGSWEAGKAGGKGNLYQHLKGNVKKSNNKNVLECHKMFEGEFQDGAMHGKGKEYRNIFYKSTVGGEGGGRVRNFISFQGLYERGRGRHGRGEFRDFRSEYSNSWVRGVWENGVMNTRDGEKFEKIMMVSYDKISMHLNADKIIGSGGYGDIYKLETSYLPAEWDFMFSNNNKKRKAEEKEEDEKFIAVKLYKFDFSTRGTSNSNYMFQMLASLLDRMIEQSSRIKDYSHILRIKAAFISKEKCRLGYITRLCKYSVGDLISSFSLEERRKVLSLDEKIRMLCESAKGMVELHALRIMHRDLKWENVLLTFDGAVKITDFDTLREDKSKWKADATKTFTRQVGTLTFVAPEVTAGEHYGLPVDVYSFGLMIYAILFEVSNVWVGLKCSCGVESREMMENTDMHKHLVEHQFRPPLNEENFSIFPRFLIDLMRFCWNSDPLNRPLFEDIVAVFENRQNSYSIISFDFTQEEDKKRLIGSKIINNLNMFFSRYSCERIGSWIKMKIPGILSLSLSHDVFGKIENDVDLGMVISKYQDVNSNFLMLQICEVEWEVEVGEEEETEGED